MKTFTKALTTIFILITINLLTINLTAQTPPPPNGGNRAPATGNTPAGGGAPTGGGLLILFALVAAYGGKKVYDFNKRNLAD